MQQIIESGQPSKCMYCSQTTYGKGCPYSPHRTHVHTDDPKRCIYCGQTTYGNGCSYNPFGKQHIHGVEFNLMIKESVHRSFSAGVLFTRLLQPITETPAFKLGLIDAQGKRVKVPETLEERNALTPIDAYILRLHRLIGEGNLELLNSGTILSLLSEPINESAQFDAKRYEKEVELQERIANMVADYKSILFDACESNISIDKIENMVVEQFIEKN